MVQFFGPPGTILLLLHLQGKYLHSTTQHNTHRQRQPGSIILKHVAAISHCLRGGSRSTDWGRGIARSASL